MTSVRDLLRLLGFLALLRVIEVALSRATSSWEQAGAVVAGIAASFMVWSIPVPPKVTLPHGVMRVLASIGTPYILARLWLESRSLALLCGSVAGAAIMVVFDKEFARRLRRAPRK